MTTEDMLKDNAKRRETNTIRDKDIESVTAPSYSILMNQSVRMIDNQKGPCTWVGRNVFICRYMDKRWTRSKGYISVPVSVIVMAKGDGRNIQENEVVGGFDYNEARVRRDARELAATGKIHGQGDYHQLLAPSDYMVGVKLSTSKQRIDNILKDYSNNYNPQTIEQAMKDYNIKSTGDMLYLDHFVEKFEFARIASFLESKGYKYKGYNRELKRSEFVLR